MMSVISIDHVVRVRLGFDGYGGMNSSERVEPWKCHGVILVCSWPRLRKHAGPLS
jgi:hypothetical protein